MEFEVWESANKILQLNHSTEPWYLASGKCPWLRFYCSKSCVMRSTTAQHFTVDGVSSGLQFTYFERSSSQQPLHPIFSYWWVSKCHRQKSGIFLFQLWPQKQIYILHWLLYFPGTPICICFNLNLLLSYHLSSGICRNESAAKLFWYQKAMRWLAKAMALGWRREKAPALLLGTSVPGNSKAR